MMNKKLAQGRHTDWLRSTENSRDSTLGERSDHQIKRSGRTVHRLVPDMSEGRDTRDAWPWSTRAN